MRTLVLSLVAALALAHPVAAEPRVYGGNEVEALRCAHLFAFTSISLEQEGFIARRDAEDMLAWALIILELHVGGTDDEKWSAMNVIAGRRTAFNTLVEFMETGDGCLERFPIG